MTPNDPDRPVARRVLLRLAIIAVFGVALHLLAPSANGLKIAGLPLGYEIAAQIGPLGLALIVVWIAGRKVAS